MARITYLTGDATSPIGSGIKIIPHICNDIGAWGAGFVLAITKKWLHPEAAYRAWHRDAVKHYVEFDTPRVFRWTKSLEPMQLGASQAIMVDTDIIIVNMIAQKGIRSNGQYVPPIRYDAVRDCLGHVYVHAANTLGTVHMPRIGCGLAGGKWDKIESIIMDELVSKGIDVFVYDL